LPAVCGFLLEKEINFLGNAVDNPIRPFVAVLGGAKISDKIPVIKNLLKNADQIIIGGGMAYTFFKAQGYEIGKSLVDNDLVETVKEFLNNSGDKIILPIDNKVVKDFDFKNMKLIDNFEVVSSDKIPANKEGIDIGNKTISKFKEILLNAKTIVWNGPMGIFECTETAEGTFEIAKILAEATEQGAITIIGGGDSASAIKQAGLKDKMTHISTGGGASLEYLEGKELPGVKALLDK